MLNQKMKYRVLVNCTTQYFQTRVCKILIHIFRFEIDSETGEIRIKAPLDYEAVKEYLLGVAATDGSYRAQTTITIDVTDTNDNAPVFAEPSYKFALMQGQDAGVLVGTVSARDLDAEGPNAEVFYRFVSYYLPF